MGRAEKFDLKLNGQGVLDAYAWPGGYPLFYIDKQASVLCATCATAALKDPHEWDYNKPIDFDVNWESKALTCDVCEQAIPSAYGDDDDDDGPDSGAVEEVARELASGDGRDEPDEDDYELAREIVADIEAFHEEEDDDESEVE